MSFLKILLIWMSYRYIFLFDLEGMDILWIAPSIIRGPYHHWNSIDQNSFIYAFALFYPVGNLCSATCLYKLKMSLSLWQGKEFSFIVRAESLTNFTSFISVSGFPMLFLRLKPCPFLYCFCSIRFSVWPNGGRNI